MKRVVQLGKTMVGYLVGLTVAVKAVEMVAYWELQWVDLWADRRVAQLEFQWVAKTVAKKVACSVVMLVDCWVGHLELH